MNNGIDADIHKTISNNKSSFGQSIPKMLVII